VVAHLIEHHLRATGRLDRAVKRPEGGGRLVPIGVVSTAAPDRLVAAKQGAGSVVVGLGQGEMFVASDIPAILAHTRDVVVLEDNEVAVVTADSVELSTLDGEPVPARRGPHPVGSDHGREGWLPALHAQGDARAAARHHRHLRGRIAPETGNVVLPDVNLAPDAVRAVERVVWSPAARRSTRRCWAAR